MYKFARKLGLTIAALLTISTSSLAFHYYGRLKLLEHTAVLIHPGKWVWVECQTHGFPATIEEVTASGIVVAVGTQSPVGLPCQATAVIAQGDRRYFMPFRTVMVVMVNGQEAWSNPFSM
jgi:hypothetical protein